MRDQYGTGFQAIHGLQLQLRRICHLNKNAINHQFNSPTRPLNENRII